MNQLQLTLMPVGACNLSCPNCVQTPWRNDFAEYQMQPDEVRYICDRVGDLGLHFTYAHITGGDPSLWRYLYEGCKILSTSGVFDYVEVWSNCKDTAPLVRVLEAGLVAQVITQSANTDIVGSQLLRNKFGGRMNIIPSLGHQVHPECALDGVLPAACGCDRVAVFSYRAYPCANAYSNMRRIGIDVEASGLWADLGGDWKSKIDSIDRYNMQACRVCLANGNVSRQAKMGDVR